MKIEIDALIEDGRLVQVFDDGSLCSEWCVHGTKLRWSCEECEEFVEAPSAVTFDIDQMTRDYHDEICHRLSTRQLDSRVEGYRDALSEVNRKIRDQLKGGARG